MLEPPILHPLTALREALGLTATDYLARLDKVHAALGHGHMAIRREKVCRWEKGTHEPDTNAQRAMASLHGIPHEAVDQPGWPHFLLLAFPEDRRILYGPWTPAGTVRSIEATSRGGAMDRRGFLIASGTVLGTIAASWSQALAAPPAPAPVAARTGRLAPHTITRLEQRVEDLRHLDDVLASETLRPTAIAEMTMLSALAHTAVNDPLGPRLFTTLAEAARMCGWQSFELGMHAAAQDFYVTGLKASAQAKDPQAGAHILSYMAIQAYSVGNPQDAVNLVQTAQRTVARHATPRVRSMLHARAARALSKTGDLRGCARELDAARDTYAQGTHDDDPPWTYSHTPGEIEMLAGSSALDLHDPRRALAHFEAAQAADYATTGHSRDSALYLTRAARAHLQLGDLDAACATASQALPAHTGSDSYRPGEALTEIRDELAQHRDVRVVREFLRLSA
ncbi:hypothetical protein GCM10027258_81140 [Amycolatopsis stemonae]